MRSHRPNVVTSLVAIELVQAVRRRASRSTVIVALMYSRCGAVVGVHPHRAELDERERAACPSRAASAGRSTGPGESRLIRQRDEREERRGHDQQGEARRRCRSLRLSSLDERELRDRRQPEERQSPRPCACPSSARRSRTAAARCRSARRVLERADELERLLRARLVREGDDDALDVEHARRCRAVLERSEQRQMAEVGAALLRVASTKPTRLMPYSGCWRILRATS